MDETQISEFQPYLFLLLGLVAIAYAIFKNSASQKIIENGIRVKGIIFALGYKPGKFSGSSDTDFNNVYDSVTVRFVTNKKEWITAELNDEFTMYYTGQYKEGDKVEIMYNESNPNEFILLTNQSEFLVRLVVILGGLAFALYGAFEIFKSYHSSQ